MNESCCYHCIHYKYLPAKTNAPAEDSYPAEDWCEEDSDNFGTEDGCRNYEEGEECW